MRQLKKRFGSSAQELRELRDTVVSLERQLKKVKRAYQLSLEALRGGYEDKLARAYDDLGRDPLTGLLNRTLLHRAFHRHAENVRRDTLGQDTSVLFIDVDKLKFINDSYGHQAGDSTLKSIAQVLSAAVREVDIVARPGGDEFIVVLTRSSLTDAAITAERIRESIAKFELDVGMPVSVSIGIAGVKLDAFKEASEVFEDAAARADKAMYEAKIRGRNQVVVAEG